jgi:hypothetical protein
MPCGWKVNMTNDLKTNLLIITKGNGFSKLKGLIKHVQFACELAQFTFLIKRQHSRVQILFFKN